MIFFDPILHNGWLVLRASVGVKLEVLSCTGGGRSLLGIWEELPPSEVEEPSLKEGDGGRWG